MCIFISIHKIWSFSLIVLIFCPTFFNHRCRNTITELMIISTFSRMHNFKTFLWRIIFFSGELIPDSKVRVSTKTLAIGCLTNAIAMTPKVFLLTLFSDDEEEDTKTILIRDVANFSEHEDPQLRGLILFAILLKVAKSQKVFSFWPHCQRNVHYFF